MKSNNGFKDSARLTTWVRYLLFAQIAIALVSIVFGQMEYHLLTKLQLGFATEAEAIAATEAGKANDARQVWVSCANLLILIVSGVMILKWIYRANYNSRQLGAKDMTFTPGWSVGAYFVPLGSLWLPYQAMKEIWQTSHTPEDWEKVSVGALVPVWWVLFLISSFLSWIAASSYAGADGINELTTSNRLHLASDIFNIALALVTLALVNAIYAAQMTHVQRTSTASDLTIQ